MIDISNKLLIHIVGTDFSSLVGDWLSFLTELNCDVDGDIIYFLPGKGFIKFPMVNLQILEESEVVYDN